jgi:hypothetical protein
MLNDSCSLQLDLNSPTSHPQTANACKYVFFPQFWNQELVMHMVYRLAEEVAAPRLCPLIKNEV